jgi:hypothetical protein
MYARLRTTYYRINLQDDCGTIEIKFSQKLYGGTEESHGILKTVGDPAEIRTWNRAQITSPVRLVLWLTESWDKYWYLSVQDTGYVTAIVRTITIVITRPPPWSSGHWLQIRRPGFDSRHYQKKKVVGLEWGPLILVSTTEELLDRKIAAPV